MTRPESATGPTGTIESLEMPDYRRILVPLDGTAFAEAAVRPAAELAAKSGASLHLATALRSEGGVMVPVEPVPADGLSYMRRDEDVTEHLAQVRDRIVEEWGATVSYEALEHDRPAEALLEHAESLGADLVVAATHSRSLIERGLLGSTAMELVRSLSCPILLVPSEDPEPDPRETPMQEQVERIVVAVDPRRGPKDEALAHALTWARLHEARVELVQVVLNIPVPTPGSQMPVTLGAGLGISDERRHLAEEKLDALVADLRKAGFDARPHVLQGPDIADALSSFAERHEADLLVVGRHDRKLLERLWSRSEADRLARTVRSSGLLICPLADPR